MIKSGHNVEHSLAAVENGVLVTEIKIRPKLFSQNLNDQLTNPLRSCCQSDDNSGSGTTLQTRSVETGLTLNGLL